MAGESLVIPQNQSRTVGEKIDGPSGLIVSHGRVNWSSINWKKTFRAVRRLRQRIYKAATEENWTRVRSLQKLMLRGETCMHGYEGTGRWQHRPVTRHYEGFEGAPVNEYHSFAHICELAAFIRERGKLGAELVSYFGGHLGDARARFENYAGEFTSLEDFAHEYTESTGLKIPAQLQNYIDYDAMGHDLELSGDILLIDLGYDAKHIFWAH